MKEKITIIIDGFTKGGAQKVLLSLIPVWQKKGISIQLVILQNSIPELPLAHLMASNVEILRIDARKISDFKGFLRFYQEVSKFSPDTIQCHLYWSQLWGSIFRLIKRNVRIVWVEHNTYFNRTLIQWNLYKILSRQTSEIIAVSSEVEDHLVKKGIRRTRVIPNPVSREFKCHNVVDRKNVFVFVGRLNKQKNPLLALDAFWIALSENLIPSDSHLVYAGEGILENEIRSRITGYGLDTKVTLLGFLSGLELAKILNESKCLVSTSLHEGFPLARIEALAAGCTIVTTKTGGIAGVLTEGSKNNSLIRGVFVVAPNLFDLANAYSFAVSDELWPIEEIRYRAEKAKEYEPNNIANKYL